MIPDPRTRRDSIQIEVAQQPFFQVIDPAVDHYRLIFAHASLTISASRTAWTCAITLSSHRRRQRASSLGAASNSSLSADKPSARGPANSPRAGRTSRAARPAPAAAVMTANDDMLDLQNLYRVLQHGVNVGVERRHKIGDVAMHEELSRSKADNLVGRHAAIGAADPKIFRRLRLAQTLEILRVFELDFFRPGAVVFKKVRQEFHIIDCLS